MLQSNACDMTVRTIIASQGFRHLIRVKITVPHIYRESIICKHDYYHCIDMRLGRLDCPNLATANVSLNAR